METREIVAYILIALLVAAFVWMLRCKRAQKRVHRLRR